MNTRPVVDPDKKPGERSPYAKPASYDENWRASGIIHDFNNLLAVILSHTSLAMAKLPADSPARTNLERATRATKRAADLSSQLSFSLTHQQDEPAQTQINELVQEVVDLLDLHISPKAKLICQLDSEVAAVALPHMRLQQVLLNLILNAADAIQKQPGQITLTTYNQTVAAEEQPGNSPHSLPPGQYAVIQLMDTGTGMDQETLNLIFEPYYTTKTNGMGIGLSTVLGIIHAYQGIIQVMSVPGEGTTFRLYLPVLDS